MQINQPWKIILAKSSSYWYVDYFLFHFFVQWYHVPVNAVLEHELIAIYPPLEKKFIDGEKFIYYSSLFIYLFIYSFIYLLFCLDLGQKYYAPQVRLDWGSNSRPPDHDRYTSCH